jgi:hypothetical protein
VRQPYCCERAPPESWQGCWGGHPSCDMHAPGSCEGIFGPGALNVAACAPPGSPWTARSAFARRWCWGRRFLIRHPYWSLSRGSVCCLPRFPVDSPERFRVEVLFSPGAAHNPFEVVPIKQDHTLPVAPRQPLHRSARVPSPSCSPLPRKRIGRNHPIIEENSKRRFSKL